MSGEANGWWTGVVGRGGFGGGVGVLPGGKRVQIADLEVATLRAVGFGG